MCIRANAKSKIEDLEQCPMIAQLYCNGKQPNQLFLQLCVHLFDLEKNQVIISSSLEYYQYCIVRTFIVCVNEYIQSFFYSFFNSLQSSFHGQLLLLSALARVSNPTCTAYVYYTSICLPLSLHVCIMVSLMFFDCVELV